MKKLGLLLLTAVMLLVSSGSVTAGEYFARKAKDSYLGDSLHDAEEICFIPADQIGYEFSEEGNSGPESFVVGGDTE